MAREFGAKSTADDVLRGVRLDGKIAVVTGGSGGLGEETARALCAAGAAVTIAARSAEKAAAAVARIRRRHPGAAVDVLPVELADPASVRRFGERWRATGRGLDILILNAGVMACPLQRTAEGWELQFATNHLGHFLLTSSVAATLRPGARVVVTSSGAHEFAPVGFDDLHYTTRKYGPWAAYGQSKTANVLFANELDRRMQEQGRGVRALSLHPGMIRTDLGRHLNAEAMREMQGLAAAAAARGRAVGVKAGKGAGKKAGGLEAMKSVAAGAATQVWAATAPELAGHGGVYCKDCSVARAAAWASDPAAATRLWAESERLLGCRFDAAAAARL